MTNQAEELSEYCKARQRSAKIEAQTPGTIMHQWVNTTPPDIDLIGMTWEECAKTIAVELGFSEIVLRGYRPKEIARLVVSNLRYCGLSNGVYLPTEGPNMTDVVKDDDTRIEEWFKLMKSNLIANGLHLTGRGNPGVKWAFEE